MIDFPRLRALRAVFSRRMRGGRTLRPGFPPRRGLDQHETGPRVGVGIHKAQKFRRKAGARQVRKKPGQTFRLWTKEKTAAKRHKKRRCGAQLGKRACPLIRAAARRGSGADLPPPTGKYGGLETTRSKDPAA